jgi:hypothetical protein
MLTPRLSTREALCTVATLFALAIWLPSAVAQPSDNEIFAAYCFGVLEQQAAERDLALRAVAKAPLFVRRQGAPCN